MAKLYTFPKPGQVDNPAPQPHTNGYGSNHGGGGGMDERVKALEEKVAVLITDIAVIKSNYATKEDTAGIRTDIANAKSELHSALRLQALTIVGSMLAIVSIASGVIIKFLH